MRANNFDYLKMVNDNNEKVKKEIEYKKLSNKIKRFIKKIKGRKW